MTVKKTPVVNYTPEMTAALVKAYGESPTKETVAEMAELFGKTTKSVIAKLSREGVYKKAEAVSKDGTPVVKKDVMVGMIAEKIGVAEEKLEGLEKAPKVALKLIFDALCEAVAAMEVVEEIDTETADEPETA